ncbi:MAG: hypothetical protein ACREIJ_02440 [Nitrospiraceae bacterium]
MKAVLFREHGGTHKLSYEDQPIQEARAAQELMLRRQFFGKIVLTMTG